MMTEPLEEKQILAEGVEFGLGRLQLEYCGRDDIRYITVAHPTDEFSGGVVLPFFYDGKLVSQERWYKESAYSGMEFGVVNEEKRKAIYEFIKIGLPALLAVKAAYDGLDIENVREKIPEKRAKIVGLGAEYSGRGKTMLATIVAHLRKDVVVVSGEVFSGNDVKKYSKVIEGMVRDARFFDFERAVEQMKEVSKIDEKLEGGTVKDVVDRIWEAWFGNKDKDILLVDLSARSEQADYPANSFGLLRFAMATFDVQRLPYGEVGQVSAEVDITAEVVEDDWYHFNLKIDEMLMHNLELERNFEASVEEALPKDLPLPKSFEK